MGRSRFPPVVVLSLVLGRGCACEPTHVEQNMAGLDIVVDATEGRVQLSRGSTALLDVNATRVGVKKGAPFYDMQFGMFDIQEDSGSFAFASALQFDGEATPTHVAFTFVDADGNPIADAALSAREGGVELSVVARGENNQVLLGSACTMAHAIGLGGQTHDVDHVGQRVPLWVSEPGIGKVDTDELPLVWQVVGRRHTSSAPIPAFVADNGGAYVLRTDAFARIDLCATDPGELTFEAWDASLFLDVYTGAGPREAQAKMVDALGRPPLPPPWTFAPWNDAIFGQESVRAFAARLRELDIPSSAIWSEDFRGGGAAGGDVYRLDQDWGIDPVMYSDFAAMVDELRAQGMQSLVYYNTFVVTGADIFEEVTTKGWTIANSSGQPYLFPGPDKDFQPTGLLDLTHPDGKAFIQGFLRDALASGARGWMADFAEWQPVEDAVLHDGSNPARSHNRYPVLWQEANREVLEEEGHLGGDDGAVAFVRSAWLGSQPLAQVIWAGDQRTSFDADDGLPTILPMGIGLSTTGFPFYTHDIAGYQSSTNDPVDKELFFRWTTLGALSPVMRTHHGTHAYANVNLFTDEETTAHWKRWAELRMRLYPYLRRLALDATAQGGLPMWVPLPLLHPAEEAVWPLLDEVYLGPSLLVAPVVTKGALSRDVVFPSGRFVSFSPAYDGDTVEGPATVEVPAALGDIPLFVRAGGIIPLTATSADTLLRDVAGLDGLESTEGDRTVFVALGAGGSFEEESGASYTLEGNGVTPPASDETDGAVVVTGNEVVSGDGFTFTLAGHPAARTTRVLFR